MAVGGVDCLELEAETGGASLLRLWRRQMIALWIFVDKFKCLFLLYNFWFELDGAEFCGSQTFAITKSAI